MELGCFTVEFPVVKNRIQTPDSHVHSCSCLPWLMASYAQMRKDQVTYVHGNMNMGKKDVYRLCLTPLDCVPPHPPTRPNLITP